MDSENFFDISNQTQFESSLSSFRTPDNKTSLVIRGVFNDQAIAVRKVCMDQRARANRELEMLNQTKHLKSTMKFLFHLELNDSIIILMPFYERNLEQFLAVQPKKLDKVCQNRIVLQLAQGIAELHKLHIVHGNLRPSCIFVLIEGGSERIVISNFRKSQLGKTFNQIFPGSSQWAAPEVLNDKPAKFSEKSDIYSFGLLAFYVWSFHETFGETFRYNRENFPFDKYLRRMKRFREEKLIADLLRNEPSYRMNAECIRRHPTFWVTNCIGHYFEYLHASVRMGRINLTSVADQGWMANVDDPIKKEMKQMVTYDDQPVSFVRFLRNLSVHFWEMKDAQIILTEFDSIDSWVINRFPSLFFNIYKCSYKDVDDAFWHGHLLK